MRSGSKVVIASRGGFTLVELLVSVALTVFMLTLFATLFSAGNDAVRIARGTGEVDRSVQGAITKLRRDLQFVYIGDNVSLGKAFSAADQIPTAGYFTIEENMPASPPYYLSDAAAANNISDPTLKTFVQAIQARVAPTVPPPGYTGAASPTTLYRQGIDERGLPVEVDVDDVLAFTVKLTGNSPENIMYGKVPVGSILDSDLDPGSRFDQPDNGIFTSPYAEVAYFLRPNRPYTVAEISRPALGSDDGKIQTPATYTLYRRELLLLSPQQRNKVEKRLSTDGYGTPNVAGTGMTASALNDMARVAALPGYLSMNPSLNSGNAAAFNPSFYHNYDVSAHFGYDSTLDPAAGGVRAFGNLAYYSLRFNDPTTVRLRQNRYGMQWQVTPTAGAVWLPLSPDLAVPGYDHFAVGANLLRMFVPGPGPIAGQNLEWHGRPTLYESTMVGSEGLADANYNPWILNTTPLYASFDLMNRKPAYYALATRPSSARRNDADVLLTNVLSFDVKVLNDDVVQGLLTQTPGGSVVDIDPTTFQLVPILDPSNWPGARTSALPALEQYYDVSVKSTTPYIARPGVVTGNSSKPWVNNPYGGSPSIAMAQQDFVDLGNLLTSEFTASLATGSPRGFLDRSLVSVPTGSTFPVESATIPIAVPWGSQTPARWASTGRLEASSSFYASGLPAIASVYDSWALEYRPDLFANNYVSPILTTPNGYLPPYDRPLRGLQITIRIWEPRTGLTREFQIVHRFK